MHGTRHYRLGLIATSREKMSWSTPIAVVGVAFRLPGGATSLESLQELVNSGRSGFVPVPVDRWNRDAFFNTQQNAKGGVPTKHGYFLEEDISEFDARFFNISSQEAATMDPKQRILLQTTYEALENAGISMENVKGSRTSVYVSNFTYDFERIGFRDMQTLSGFHTTSVGPAILANRLSYFFDLKGPSFTLDTGCSGGLVALHQACQSLRLAESNLAIVAGAQLLIDPDQSTNMSTLGMLNADGHCYAFDSRGSGYGRGEGVVTLILKRLDEALADGDPIQTVIVNSGLNQDGRSAGSLMSPSGEAQRDLMQSVYAQVGLDPSETPYVEAHGTGTQVGDTNEVTSIYQVFCEGKQRQNDIVVGSVKANIGHLEAVAGLAGFVKSINVLNSKLMPPQLNYIEPKPTLMLEERRISIPTQLSPLPPGPCRASVNSFGYGGTNAHVIIESASSFLENSSKSMSDIPLSDGKIDWHHSGTHRTQLKPINDLNSVTGANGVNGVCNGSDRVHQVNFANGVAKHTPDETPIRLFLICANSEASLKAYGQKLSAWALNHKPCAGKMGDLSHTLLTRRSLLPWRYSVAASDYYDLSDKLSGIRAVRTSTYNRLTFVFTGQGAQWQGMGRELIQYPVFERSITKSENLLLQMGCDWHLTYEIFGDEASSRLGEAEVAQPATTALQIALTDLLSSLGVFPSYVVGHSSGEIGAAYASGALTHESAMKAAYRRGVYSGEAKRKNRLPGSMLAVGLGEKLVRPYIKQIKKGRVCVACVNSPESTTISGDVEALDELKQMLDAESIFARRLRVDTAYHSHHMQTVADEYLQSLSDIVTGSTRQGVTFCSTVIGSLKQDAFTADYWVRNLVSQVQFVEGLQLAANKMKESLPHGDHQFTFIEIGPTGALAGPAKQTLSGIEFKHTYLSVLNRGTNASKTLLTMIGQLIELGHGCDLKSIASLAPPSTSRDVEVLRDLPGYAFDKSSHWVEPRISAAHRFRKFPYHDLCGILDPASSSSEPRWRHTLNLDALPWLKDHAIDGDAVFPASGYVAMVIEAMKQLVQVQEIKGTIKNFLINDMTLNQAVIVSHEGQNAEVELQLTISPSKAGSRWHEFKMFSYDKKGKRWVENCNGLVATDIRVENDDVEGELEDAMRAEGQLKLLQTIQSNSAEVIERNAFYDQLQASGNHYGSSFAVLGDVHKDLNHGWCSLAVPDYSELLPGHYMQPHLVHPSLLDTFSHIGALLAKKPCRDASIVVGKINEMIISFDFAQTAGAELYLATTQQPQDIRTVNSQSVVFQRHGDDRIVPALAASYTYRAFTVNSHSDEEGPFSQKKVYSLVHKPDIDFLNAKDLSSEDPKSVVDVLINYLNAMAFKQPQLKVLEISCSTEGAIVSLLSSQIKNGKEPWASHYDIASHSAELEGQLELWRNHVNLRQLDITKDLPSEALDTKYDVVIAADIVDAPANASTALINIHNLLCDGGKLVLVGSSRPDLQIKQIREVLQRYSYSGIDILAKTTGPKSFVLVTSSIANVSTESKRPSAVNIVYGSNSMASRMISWGLSEIATRSEHPWSFFHRTLNETTISQNATYIILDTAEKSLLLDHDPNSFIKVRELLNATANIFWVSMQDTTTPTASSMKSMMQGASRVIRRENEGTTSLTLFDIDDQVTRASALDICQQLLKIVAGPRGSFENEYVYRSGHVMIPRLKQDQKFLRGVGSRFRGQDNLIEVPYHSSDRPLRLEVENPGLLNSLRFVGDNMPQGLKPRDIQLSSRAHGINFKDVFIALGQMPPSVTMVGEMSGVVTAVGRDMANRYKIGDHVMGFFANSFASNPRINGDLAHVVPKNMEFSIAATIPCVYTTAYHCLFEVARLRKGQSILVTAASGGVGQAAIQLAQHAGAGEIFVTLGSKSKKQLVIEEYGIPANHVFSSRKLDFKQGILRMTRGRGVDVVLNSLTGDMLTDAFDCVAKLGTFCEIGKGDIYKGNHLRLTSFDRSVTFSSVDLVTVAQERPDIVYSHLESIVELFEKRRLRPLKPINAYPIQQIEEAFRLIAGRKHTGKIVLESPETSIVKATPPEPKKIDLPGHAAYVIAGGLGDIGRRLAVLLSSRGAKHVVLLSRRSLLPEVKKELDGSVAHYGSKIHVLRCDITVESNVAECADYCLRNQLIVKGVIHSGMVLRDRPFSNMTHEEFRAPLEPKVYGTINLDNAFASSELDFFIMLSSSATIIGNGSQANYAAGNAFQDAFAHSHAESHTTYVALNLGAVEGSHAVAETSQAQSNRLKSISITMDELLLGIEYAMSAQAHEDKLSLAIMGISRQGFVDADDQNSLKNPLFSHLPAARDEVSAASKGSNDIVHRLSEASTLGEAQALIAKAIITKCASFLGCTVEDVSQNQPLYQIGFDSLVSIELKNWLLRTFESPIQTAEISGASSILALAAMTTSRSKLVNLREGSAEKVESPKTNGVIVKTNGQHHQQIHGTPNAKDFGLQGFKCCFTSPPLKLPMFDLEDYLDCYRMTVGEFAKTNEERDSIDKAMDEFRNPMSLGAKTYAALIERANDPKIECWLADTESNSVFLHFRHPLAPWNSFIHTHHDAQTPHSQAERAAVLTTVAFRFLQGMERNEIENDWLGPRPLCSDYWRWMFNAVRLPIVHCDKMKIFSQSRYVAVLRKGHVFKITLENKQGNLPLEQAVAMFQKILDSDVGQSCWAGILTTDFRDTWAVNRESIIAINESNSVYFQTIEEATFVVCLDEGKPETNEEMVAQGIAGDGFNRWFDKTMQFVVYANGRSAHISDHTMIDGTTPLRLTEFIHDAIISHQHFASGNAESTAILMPEYFPLQTTSDMDEYIQQVRRRYRKTTLTRGYRYIKTSGLSQSLAAGTGLSSKHCLDFAMQLAARLHFGYLPAAWEPISVQHFHRGRPDPRQPVSSHVVAFCDAALNKSVPLAEKRRLMEIAAAEWDKQTKRTQEGSGFLRRTEALLGILAKLVPPPKDDVPVMRYTEEQLAKWSWADSLASIVGEGMIMPTLFTNKVFNRVYPGNMEQVRNEGEFVDAAGYVMNDNCIWISNRVRESYVALSVVGDADKVGDYEECFHQAVAIIRSIMAAK
ncbi:beta-ketoacyl synthase domain-containing protein [Xylariaceae sp. FL0255]|nr:beta-ketoacyl synthase domain-containing protein [Xylariaceae sp. FL0255]